MTCNKRNIILVGGGGHCRSCIEVINSNSAYNIVGILDKPSELGKSVSGVKVVGNDNDYLKFHDQGCSFFITVGQIKTSAIRRKIFDRLKSINANIETLIASTAYVSSTAVVEEGSIIMHRTFVNTGVKIGANNIINTGAILEHDVHIGDHNHISTGVLINGDCVIGSNNFIGSNTCIANGVYITNNLVIGAGTVIIRNIKEEGVYVGNPAKKIK
ncbi:acetyltransferase [Niabella aquatica]